MTKLALAFSTIIFCLQMANVKSFQASFVRKSFSTPKPLQSSVPGDLFWDVNPVNKIDLDHAHDCADHFGECKIQEMEDMKTALHTERVQHQAAAGIMALDPVEELDHRLLEEDLTVQLALLKGELNDLLPYSFERKVSDIVNKDMKGAASTDASRASYYGHNGNVLKRAYDQGENMFLIPSSVGDAAVFCLALFIIAFFPVLLH